MKKRASGTSGGPDELIGTATGHRPRIETAASSARTLEAAAHRLAARRQRDALPGRIATRRLVLRPPIRGDVPDLVRLADNPRIHAVLARLPSPYTRADAIAFVDIFAQRDDERPYAVTLEGEFIGVVGLTFFPAGKAPELGYWLGEPYWGKGYMSEAVTALLDAAFATGRYPLVNARALASNAASLNVLEKAGFRRVGEAVDDCGPHGQQPVVHLEREQPRWM